MEVRRCLRWPSRRARRGGAQRRAEWRRADAMLSKLRRTVAAGADVQLDSNGDVHVCFGMQCPHVA